MIGVTAIPHTFTFDADGVLFDSDESNVAYYNWIFAQIGEPPLDRDEARLDHVSSPGKTAAVRLACNRPRPGGGYATRLDQAGLAQPRIPLYRGARCGQANARGFVQE